MYLTYIRRFFWNLRDRCQRFIRGYAWSDIVDMDWWFIRTAEPMLRYLQEHHYGTPGKYTDEEWTARLKEMADELHLCDEENVVEEEFGGDYMKCEEIYQAMEAHKTRFFKLFSEDFYCLWD